MSPKKKTSNLLFEDEVKKVTLPWEEISKEHNLDSSQLKALQNAFEYNFSLISGYAGTGKSYVIYLIERYLKKYQGWEIVKVAPTGKAAIRIAGKTIHSWLLPNIIDDPNNPEDFIIKGFKRKSFHDEFTTKSKVCLIVDESSMIDSDLNDLIMKKYHASIKAGQIVKLVFVGDSFQLEPVGAGKPFLDFLADKSLPSVFLDKIFRNVDGNDIPLFAKEVRTNGMPSKVGRYNNVKVYSRLEAIKDITENVSNQIIAPFNKLCLEINESVQRKRMSLNHLDLSTSIQLETWDVKSRKYLKSSEVYGNDKVLITKNSRYGELKNGSTCFVKLIVVTTIENKLTTCVRLVDEASGEEIDVPLKWFSHNATLGYAITVHKAQGSQWDNVYYVTSSFKPTSWDMKKLDYTACTRAIHDLKIVI